MFVALLKVLLLAQDLDHRASLRWSICCIANSGKCYHGLAEWLLGAGEDVEKTWGKAKLSDRVHIKNLASMCRGRNHYLLLEFKPALYKILSLMASSLLHYVQILERKEGRNLPCTVIYWEEGQCLWRKEVTSFILAASDSPGFVLLPKPCMR